MRQLFSFIAIAFFFASCSPNHDIVWGIHNRSDHDIYFVIDLQPEDTVLSVGSYCRIVEPRSIGELSSKTIRHMKDSLHMYIIDGEKVAICGWCKLAEEQIELIVDNKAILDCVTRTPQSESFGYLYEPKSD